MQVQCICGNYCQVGTGGGGGRGWGCSVVREHVTVGAFNITLNQDQGQGRSSEYCCAL